MRKKKNNYLLILGGALILFCVTVVLFKQIQPIETVSLRGELVYDEGAIVFSPCDTKETYTVKSSASNAYFNFHNKLDEFIEGDVTETTLITEIYGILYRSEQEFDILNIVSMELGNCEDRS